MVRNMDFAGLLSDIEAVVTVGKFGILAIGAAFGIGMWMPDNMINFAMSSPE